MILAILYAVAHFFLGPLAAYWTYRRLNSAGFTDGCFLFLMAFGALLVPWLALAILLIDWLTDKIVGK